YVYLEFLILVCTIYILAPKNVWNQDVKKKETYAMFISKKHGVKMTIFTIHRIHGMISEEEMDQKIPMMQYVGYYGGCTYGIEYGEIQNKGQNREFSDILNKDMKNLKFYFEYVK
ncbi:hypothetical protein, partial [Anaerostipes sp.]|uniref:hypothetical protein n=1 Tax=Anaerostipes sp. TaxID=1872530 RepID=UPI003FEF315D